MQKVCANSATAVTNARFAALHGLSSPCPPLDDARSTSQIARSSRAASAEDRKRGPLPSGRLSSSLRLRGFTHSVSPATPFAPAANRQTEAILVFRIGRSKMLPVQPNKLETLDDLLAQAEHYANYSMRNMGRMPPTLFLVGPDGPLMFMPESLPDDGAKDDFATNARLMCIAHAATSVVMALEAWAKFATPGEKFD